MAPTFILTRAFAISALFVGAFPVSYAAPIPSAASPSVRIAARGCRQMGCLYALPTGNTDTSDDASSTSITTTLSIPPGGFSQESMQVIDFLISALSAARSAATNSSTGTTVDAVEPTSEGAVKVDGFATAAIAAELEEKASSATASTPERRSEDLSFVPEGSIPGLANQLKTPTEAFPRALPVGAIAETVAREAVNLDALV
ncbi:hypothetical protein L226DRAFT_525944 [Lentinus tigrinus ALCF2SS1-7]|uniref:Uncharacterized protein n=1 Tax=Lentinus tigrinus ALCF2SS1-6 TaxID=1328759 RepID=A0A5C2S3B7_9APHY|nr:hypothetical protein L227DRAFT_565145 [Lentinus tigrinus ALCF2SS1-6]RPD70452.1 hypothetical protein L226DRAFT_525944 [Lentinus tigrinus ALCF2SS1-7]